MSPILSNRFCSRQTRYRVHCLFAVWSIRERRTSGLDIKFQLETPNADPGSTLRSELDVLDEDLE